MGESRDRTVAAGAERDADAGEGGRLVAAAPAERGAAADHAAAAGERTFRIAFMSDTHGHVLPVSYATGEHVDAGLANLCTRLGTHGREARLAAGDLVLDGGDSLQGTPLISRWLAGRAAGTVPPETNPVACAFNELGLNAFTLGNHDFNFGYEALADFVRAMGATCVCANVTDATGCVPILPFVVVTLGNGLRLGITGAVTSYVNVWERAEHLGPLTVGEVLPALERTAADLRGNCDVSICVYHGGFEEDLATGRVLSRTAENQACQIARACDFDILLTGHQHMAVEGVGIAGTWCVQPPANAARYVSLSGAVDADGHVRVGSRLEPVGDVTDVWLARELAPLEREVDAWLDERVGELDRPIDAAEEGKLDVALHGSRLAGLINQMQLALTGADVSCTGLGNEAVGLASPVTRRGICSAYQFANTLVVLAVTPDVLRATLERCASYLELGPDGSPRVSASFSEPKVEHYNYDLYAGIRWEGNLTRPVGERVVSMRMADGSPVPDELELVCNDYRASGTGGYDVLADCRVVRQYSEADVPELLARYIARESPVRIVRTGGVRFTW